MPAAYVLLTRWDELKKDAAKTGKPWVGPEKRDDLLDWFLAAAKAAGVTFISEGGPLENWVAKQIRGR